MGKIEKLKEIISAFIKVDSSKIINETPIDKRAIPGSILIHRMYSALIKEGFKIDGRYNFKTFGDLLNALNIEEQEKPSDKQEVVIDENQVSPSLPKINLDKDFLVGIDIEEVKNMPKVDDFREDPFYKENFSPNEISYCILQKNPLVSFSGKFSAKEAIVKADNTFMDTPFNEIEILNDDNGKPYFNDFEISISHTDTYSAAAAVKLIKQKTAHGNKDSEYGKAYPPDQLRNINEKQGLNSPKKKQFVSIIISIVAVLFLFFFLFILSK